MKVVLTAVNSKFIHSNLAIRYLKAYTEDLSYQCIMKEFTINDRIERIVEELISEKPNIIGFSCYIWNIDYVIQISRLIKLIDSNIKIFLGGPEVSYDAVSYMKPKICDYILEGEGEESYREFIECKIKKNISISQIKGLYYLDNEIVKYNGIRKLMDINNIKFPYKEDDNLDNKIVYYEASRGCPFNCKYCLSSTTHGVRFLNLERVKKELKFFIDKKVKLVKFIDRTFNCNPTFAYDIWKFLIEKNTETTFHFEISADILTNDQINLLKKASKGRFQFEVGVQTTNDTVLKNINRTANFKDIKEKITELLQIKNIKQHLDLIAGLPGEDFNSFKNSFNELYTIHPEEIQLGFLKLLKGSLMRQESKKWDIVYSPYPPYEILKTSHITYNELVKLKRVEMVLDKYYNSGKFTNILEYFIKKFHSPFDLYYGLGEFFYDKGYLARNISSADYYKIFIEFNEEFLNEDSFILKEVIKFDYLMFNKKKWIPNFLDRERNKELEKKIKDKIVKGVIKEDKFTSNYHLEKFNIDIIKYTNEHTLEYGDFYVLYNENSKNMPKSLKGIV
ncbi:B12-binding domain-containing radical SAM protein [Clostridium rectalis]|uniref:B12-binding domain-containing radical SAM protein n=1 Tax=Clostridium rectalis TaxID=2040295 RepID=UPI000F643680|nr:B12-binding domain-containing radical SAM protein [Clostridium rectalis]